MKKVLLLLSVSLIVNFISAQNCLLKQVDEYNRDGETLQSTVYQYDENSKLTGWNLIYNEIDLTDNIDLVYNDKGQISKVIITHKDEPSVSSKLYTYQGDDLVQIEGFVDDISQGLFWRFCYDSTGCQTEDIGYRVTGNDTALHSRIIKECDENGNIIKETTIEPSPVGSTLYTWDDKENPLQSLNLSGFNPIHNKVRAEHILDTDVESVWSYTYINIFTENGLLDFTVKRNYLGELESITKYKYTCK